jgi:hypothetical protein
MDMHRELRHTDRGHHRRRTDLTLANVRKAVTALVGVAAQLAALGVVPERYLPWVQVVIALGTAIGVYVVPNAPPAVDHGPRDTGQGAERVLVTAILAVLLIFLVLVVLGRF